MLKFLVLITLCIWSLYLASATVVLGESNDATGVVIELESTTSTGGNTTEEIWTVVNNGTFVEWTDVPTCTGTDKLAYNGSHLRCLSDEGGAGGNTTEEIRNAVNNSGFYNITSNISYFWDDTDDFNTTQMQNNAGTLTIVLSWLTDFIWTAVNNGTFMPIGTKVGNTTAEIQAAETDPNWAANYSAHNTTWSTDTDTFNTTDEIWTVVNNNTFAKVGDAGGVDDNDTLINLFVGNTSTKYSGNLSNVSHVGYVRANSLCAEQYADSHFCLEVELMKSTIDDDTIGANWQLWVAKGAPGYTAAANDCEGWTKETSEIGPFWDFTENTGVGAGKLTPCSSELNLACCGP